MLLKLISDETFIAVQPWGHGKKCRCVCGAEAIDEWQWLPYVSSWLCLVARESPKMSEQLKRKVRAVYVCVLVRGRLGVKRILRQGIAGASSSRSHTRLKMMAYHIAIMMIVSGILMIGFQQQGGMQCSAADE